MNAEYFPQGIVVTGKVFYNRNRERQSLSKNIVSGRHTWMMAPRRYGKTSLIHQCILDLENKKRLKTRAVILDLLMKYQCRSIHKSIVRKRFNI